MSVLLKGTSSIKWSTFLSGSVQERNNTLSKMCNSYIFLRHFKKKTKSLFSLQYFKGNKFNLLRHSYSESGGGGAERGAGREVWYQVYMIAPVKKSGRVRLSTNFPSKQIWWRMHTWKDDEVLLGLSFPASKHQEKVFMNFFKGIFGHQEVWCMNSPWLTSLFVIQHLGKFSYFI